MHSTASINVPHVATSMSVNRVRVMTEVWSDTCVRLACCPQLLALSPPSEASIQAIGRIHALLVLLLPSLIAHHATVRPRPRSLKAHTRVAILAGEFVAISDVTNIVDAAIGAGARPTPHSNRLLVSQDNVLAVRV